MYVSVMFLSIMLLSGFLYVFRSRGIEKNLFKIIYYDYRGYDREIFKKPDNYFRKGGQPIAIVNPVITDNKLADNDRGGVLKLRENTQLITTDRENIHINNPENIHNNNPTNDNVQFTKRDVDLRTSPPVSNKGMNTIPDYNELSPVEQLKHDNRSSLPYLKDLMICEHTILSLVFRKSLKDPLFIRVLQMVFSFSMQFGINAMLYTDNVIDDRQSKLADVNIP
jgi:hypothetical protein